MATPPIITRDTPLIMARAIRLFPIVVVAGLSVLIATLSIPSLIAALIAFPSNSLIERLREGDVPLAAGLRSAAIANAEAAEIFEPGRYSSNAAAALLALDLKTRQTTNLDAEQTVIRALSAAPASPYNWNRLAFLRAARNDRVGAEQAWQMSVLTGRYVPELGRGRMLLAFKLFPISDPAMVDLLIDQVELTAVTNSMDLAKAARQGHAEIFVRTALWKDSELLAKFNKDYKYVAWVDRQKL